MPDTVAQITAPIGYGPTEAAKAFSPALSGRSIRAALKSGVLVSYRVARSRVILAEDLVAFIKAQPRY